MAKKPTKKLTKAGTDEILAAVKKVLTVSDYGICNANLRLLRVSVKHGLVTMDECNTGD